MTCVYFVRKHLNQLFDSNICRAEEWTNSCSTAEWHPQSLKQHTVNLGASYLCQKLFVLDTRLPDYLSPVISSRASSLLYSGDHIFKRTFRAPWPDCIAFIAARIIYSERKQKVRIKGGRAFFPPLWLQSQSFQLSAAVFRHCWQGA